MRSFITSPIIVYYPSNPFPPHAHPPSYIPEPPYAPNSQNLTPRHYLQQSISYINRQGIKLPP
ncbi:hypothetical protein P152DRAFT_460931 [Eremomyces bilateralis CBS 781.70]|uniref:Uncharacterized protein n=1 Tax=Eremomyces bilateralis CBS 781.70 TaxID=1392243 RepID=A0A6G1FWY7_9PEZI|nr:uncharacterized protein P152DRAFT_460931 [Eremomyces bilateralis CBS 781.70]KAF1810139.1 hypothetical protein P152DRAFT_460931 [Eremomyces bilateralis CBS 781.70]